MSNLRSMARDPFANEFGEHLIDQVLRGLAP
jgi:hypothetical protein